MMLRKLIILTTYETRLFTSAAWGLCIMCFGTGQRQRHRRGERNKRSVTRRVGDSEGRRRQDKKVLNFKKRREFRYADTCH